ncbi:MAG: type II toxin-antitoxin system ParD family antitoxin [Phenylobacterium sp.]|uniref:type II toxin-antitoxin system ParD family antitoxin n=1 Tax=Phenylobacterium sp. TaxID=1871053 RepID=UPI003BB4CF4C
MPARNVNLTGHLGAFVDANVASGRYQNASEVVRDGLRLLEQRQREDEAKLQHLRTGIDLGREDVRSGRSTEVRAGDALSLVQALGRSAKR